MGSENKSMTSLMIDGRVTLRNAEFIGDGVILNRSGQKNLAKQSTRVILDRVPNEPEQPNYFDQLKRMGFWTGDHLRLENVLILISEDGKLSVQPVLPDGAIKLSTTAEAIGEFKRLKALGAEIMVSPGFEIRNGGWFV